MLIRSFGYLVTVYPRPSLLSLSCLPGLDTVLLVEVVGVILGEVAAVVHHTIYAYEPDLVLELACLAHLGELADDDLLREFIVLVIRTPQGGRVPTRGLDEF